MKVRGRDLNSERINGIVIKSTVCGFLLQIAYLVFVAMSLYQSAQPMDITFQINITLYPCFVVPIIFLMYFINKPRKLGGLNFVCKCNGI